MKIAKGALGPVSQGLELLLKEVRMPIEEACNTAEGLISMQNENEKFLLVAVPMLNGRTGFSEKDEDFEELSKLWAMEVEIDFPVLEMEALRKAGGQIDAVTLVQLVNAGVLSLSTSSTNGIAEVKEPEKAELNAVN